MQRGSRAGIAFVLHAHLPFVRHDKGALEELWLFEAIAETYLPLLEVLEGWERDGVDYRLSLSFTPTLAAMLRDPLLLRRFDEHRRRLRRLLEREAARHAGHERLAGLTAMYQERLDRAERLFEENGRDLVAAFGRIAEGGRLEIFGSCATHGLLPLLAEPPEAVQAQVRVGIEEHRRAFGRPPRGFWLPECGIGPGVAEALATEGVRYTVVEQHGVLHADPRPRYGVYAPVYTRSGLALFGRDPESSAQVWSATEGYPGDPWYRDFYRDAGFDREWPYIEEFMPYGVRTHTGLKYHRVSGPHDEKELYDPQRAAERAAVHAGNFVFNREHQVRHLSSVMDRPPIIVAPYDAELFGHWWFEGPAFLDQTMRRLAAHPLLRPALLSEWLDERPHNQMVEPAPSTWGYNGYFEVWLEGSNDWIYRHLHEAARRMVRMAQMEIEAETADLARRALAQAARELLLAQSSDWPFILKTGTVVPYARRRLHEHLNRFFEIEGALSSGALDPGWLEAIETPQIFPHIDPDVYRSDRTPLTASAP